MIRMSERTGGRVVLASVLVCATLAFLGTRAMDDLDASPRDDRRRFDFTGPRLSVIVTGDGQVRLEPGRATGLTVVRTLAGSAAKHGNADWELDGHTLRLSAECTGIAINCHGVYVVRVPSGTDVSVTSRGGSVTGAGLRGTLRISTSAGDVRLRRTTGALRLYSASGRIELVGARSAQVDARTGRAPISLSFARPPARVAAYSNAGDIDVRLPVSRAEYRVEAVAGSRAAQHIGIVNDPSASRRVTVRTEHGAVTVREAPH